MPIFLLLFIIVPLIEIALFIQVGDQVGVLPTVALVVLTAVIGVLLLRWQGIATLMRARERMQAGQVPAQEMVEGFLLAVAGIMLLTPGFFTDSLGFLLLVPQLRQGLYKTVSRRMVIRRAGPGRQGEPEGRTFDGEFERGKPTDQDSLPPKK